MQIKTFISELEANDFIKTIKPISLSYEKGRIVLIYSTFPTVEEMKAKKIREDKAEAMVGLKEAEMQLQYLQTIANLSEEDAKIVKGSIEGVEGNIKNYKAKLKTIELWKNE